MPMHNSFHLFDYTSKLVYYNTHGFAFLQSDSPVPLDLDITVASLDGQRILIETLEQYSGRTCFKKLLILFFQQIKNKDRKCSVKVTIHVHS